MLNQIQQGNAGFNYNVGIVPNPASYQTSVSVDVPVAYGTAKLKLFDGYNNQGLLETHDLVAGTNSIILDVSGLISGLYIVSLEIDGNVVENRNLIVIH